MARKSQRGISTVLRSESEVPVFYVSLAADRVLLIFCEKKKKIIPNTVYQNMSSEKDHSLEGHNTLILVQGEQVFDA